MKVLIIPGLNDGPEWYEACVDDWCERFGIDVVITRLNWREGREDFEKEYERLVHFVYECGLQEP